ncbi:hypothetical protein OAU74_02760, partial [bacterium]|nr:hypothetical protein [bacterium]
KPFSASAMGCLRSNFNAAKKRQLLDLRELANAKEKRYWRSRNWVHHAQIFYRRPLSWMKIAHFLIRWKLYGKRQGL